MALARRQRTSLDIWPGFVDALATLLMVIIFLLMIFVVSQFYLSDALVGRDKALASLNEKVTELADLLDLERKSNTALRSNVSQITGELESSVAKRDALNSKLGSLMLKLEDSQSAQQRFEQDLEISREKLTVLQQDILAMEALKNRLEHDLKDAHTDVGAKTKELGKQKEISVAAKAQLALLNQQMAALRKQLADVNEALEISERKDKEAAVKIANLGKRLNAALASKVHELAKYRSEFFGRLRKVLGARSDIQVVGDRFVFQSEVLFASGAAELGETGKVQLGQFANTLKEIAAKMPVDIDWVLRVDGHTDRRPINTTQFPSNWELSAARAISVVKFLNAQGLPSKRLAAAGFASFFPLDQRRDEIAYRRNRRIEMKFDQR
jgi:chemotaxis protein MotB